MARAKRRAANPERERDRARRDAARAREKNPELRRQISARYRAKNVEKTRVAIARSKAKKSDYYRQANREYAASAYPGKAEAIKERQRSRRARDPERMREIKRRSYAKDIEHSRALGRADAARRRAFRLSLPSELIDRRLVYIRDGGLCGICGAPVDQGRFDIDHIVPVSRGGPNLYSNVQVAHPSCNYRKGARLMDDLAALTKP